MTEFWASVNSLVRRLRGRVMIGLFHPPGGDPVDREQGRHDGQPELRQEARLGRCLAAASWLAAALHCAGVVSCAATEPAPQAPAGKLQISDSAAAPPEPSGGAALEIIPGRVRTNYISKSDGATATVDRNAQGWHLTLSAPAAQAERKAESAGYCWEITELNATKFSTLALDLSQVSQAGEIQVRLEQQDATVQEAKLEYLTQGILVVDLANYPRVRPALARLCLVASGSPDTPAATRADFVLRRALLQ